MEDREHQPFGAPRLAPEGEREGFSPLANLVNTTFIGREYEWVNRVTGEIRKPPITIGYIQYPDGGGELYGVSCGQGRPKLNDNFREAIIQQAEEKALGYEKASALAAHRKNEKEIRCANESTRRARSNVRRKCRLFNLSVMVTLTFPAEGVHDYDRALRLVQDFIHDHGIVLHLNGKWLAVPELHPGGHGWHWHVLVAQKFSKKQLQLLRTKWTDYLTRHGLSPSGDAEYTRIHVKKFNNSLAASGYAAKYVGKAFDNDNREKYRKRYLAAHGMKIEIQKGGANSFIELIDVIEQIQGANTFDSKSNVEWSGPPLIWAVW